MAYLLSLNSDHVLDAQTFFVDLPHTELYIQTALYYYSLELYKTLYPNCEKLYLFKPIDLIRHMMVAAQTMSEENEIVKAFRYWQNHLLDGTQIANTEQAIGMDTLELEQIIANRKEDSEETEEAQHIDNIPVTSSDMSEDQQKSTVLDEIDVEWTDDWGDFSDTEATDDKKNKSRSQEMEAISQNEAVAFEHNITECITEEDRFAMFQRIFSRMNNLEDYTELKKIMSHWPKFNTDQVALNPILRMMKAIIALITKTNVADFENKILREHEELIELLASKEVMTVINCVLFSLHFILWILGCCS